MDDKKSNLPSVHWYYPAYERPGEDPAAVQIRTNAFGVELARRFGIPSPKGT
jgi:hypothetical protein